MRGVAIHAVVRRARADHRCRTRHQIGVECHRIGQRWCRAGADLAHRDQAVSGSASSRVARAPIVTANVASAAARHRRRALPTMPAGAAKRRAEARTIGVGAARHIADLRRAVGAAVIARGGLRKRSAAGRDRARFRAHTAQATEPTATRVRALGEKMRLAVARCHRLAAPGKQAQHQADPRP